MPSFFSKVFGRKKDEKESSATHTRRHSASASLLEGKYEAVSPTSSPTADKFKNELGNKEKEKDGFSLFRPRSRSTAATTNPHPDTAKPPRLVPHLDLNLSVQQETKSRALDVVFEAADDRGNLPVAIIGERRLAPLETFLLVKACAAAIVNRGGLETLGVMHPHWYSASPEIQRRLISLFILSLAPTNTEATLSPTPDSATALFESELNYTRSPHDIAAVLRWALRHLRLEGSSFGSNSDGEDVWKWYTTYSEAERSANYPPTAFSQSLAPSIPGSHFQLLTVTLDIITSLAAHAESNGSSGSKLSKFLGLWLLTAQRALESDDWVAFYNRWERAGRILEHLFLSYIRDEAEKKKIALRLTDLVKQFPYTTGTDLPEDGLLSRPRFSTRLYDTLFVRVSTELPTDKSPKPKHHLLRLIAQSFKAEVIATGQYAELWEQIKKTASEEAEGDSPSLSRIFNDDTVRLLSLVPLDPDANKTITLAIPPTREPRGRRRSASLGGGKPNGTQPSAAHGKTLNGKTQPVVSPEPASVPLPASPTDWSDFSSAGFGETSLSKNLAFSLLGDDVEVTVPPHAQPKRRASKKGNAGSSPAASRRSSVDNPRPGIQRPPADVPTSTTPADEPKPAKTQTSFIDLIKLDEAFIDFWSDALTDPILTSNWPTFVLCQLKANLPFAAETPEGKPIQWLVIEHAFTYPPPPPPPPAPVPEPVSPTTSNTKRAASPRPSIQSNISSRKSSTFSARTRFSFFGTDKGSPTTTTPTGTPKTGFSFSQRKRSAKASRVGEMGEVLAEVEESPSKPAEGLGLVIGEEAKEPQASKEAPTATVTTKPQTLLATVPEAEPAAPEVPEKAEGTAASVATEVHDKPPAAESQKEEPVTDGAKAEELAPVQILSVATPTDVAPEVPSKDVAAESEPPVVPAKDDIAEPETSKVDAVEPPAIPITEVPAPAPTEEVTSAPTDDSTPTSLAPVPVVDAEPTPVPDAPAPVSIEPVVLDEASHEKPIASHPASADEVTATSVQEDGESLPPAPEPVVLAGSTPGPEVALSTSEPIALAEAAATEEETVVPEVPAAQPESVQDPIPEPSPEPAPEPEQVVDSEVVVEVVPPTPAPASEEPVVAAAVKVPEAEDVSVPESQPEPQAVVSEAEPTPTVEDIVLPAPEPAPEAFAAIEEPAPVETAAEPEAEVETSSAAPIVEVTPTPEAPVETPVADEPAPPVLVEEAPAPPAAPEPVAHDTVATSEESASEEHQVVSGNGEAHKAEEPLPASAEPAALPEASEAEPATVAPVFEEVSPLVVEDEDKSEDVVPSVVNGDATEAESAPPVSVAEDAATSDEHAAPEPPTAPVAEEESADKVDVTSPPEEPSAIGGVIEEPTAATSSVSDVPAGESSIVIDTTPAEDETTVETQPTDVAAPPEVDTAPIPVTEEKEEPKQ